MGLIDIQNGQIMCHYKSCGAVADNSNQLPFCSSHSDIAERIAGVGKTTRHTIGHDSEPTLGELIGDGLYTSSGICLYLERTRLYRDTLRAKYGYAYRDAPIM